MSDWKRGFDFVDMNLKWILRCFIFLFYAKSSKFSMYFMLRAHLNLNNPHFNYSLATLANDYCIRYYSPRKPLKYWWPYVVENSAFNKIFKIFNYFIQKPSLLEFQHYHVERLQYIIRRVALIFSRSEKILLLFFWVERVRNDMNQEGSTQS